MELALSLGDTPKPFSFLHKPQKNSGNNSIVDQDRLGFCMAVGKVVIDPEDEDYPTNYKPTGSGLEDRRRVSRSSSSDPPVQLDLLPVHEGQSASRTKFPNFHWLNENFVGEPERAEGSSPNSATVVPRMGFAGFMKGKRGLEGIAGSVNGGRSYYRGSDEDQETNVNDINMGRKKLRLSKEQSAFLEESFKEHSTLNPKQKLALAKQLNLRTRQVEVWFQNRRARTKLKQTELDCEHLKRCFETLTEENKRLQKELQELRALKASKPFYMQLPATTLTMCPSCERVASTTASSADTFPITTAAAATVKPTKTLSLSPNGQQADHS